MITPNFRSISTMKSLFPSLSPAQIRPYHLSHLPLIFPQIPSYSYPIVLSNPHPSFPLKHPPFFASRAYSVMPALGPDQKPTEGRNICGEIQVIIGPMFAGKTTALLRRIQLAIDSGRSVAIIKSDKDIRYSLDSVVSHDGENMRCFALPKLSAFRSKISTDDYAMIDVIGIDEAQFFEDLYDFCRTAADHDGKTVIVAGLDGDYLRRGFGTVLDIIPIADSVTKLTSRCELCGRPAFFTLRKSSQLETELIGGADVYMPVCRRHYVNGQAVKETAAILLEGRKAEPCLEAVSLSSF